MIKCKDCIFCIRKKCVNPESDEDGMKVFEEYDGCSAGKKAHSESIKCNGSH